MNTIWHHLEDVECRLGAWSFRRRGAEIADLFWENVPALRAIRVVVRDADWQTLEWEQVNVSERAGGDASIVLTLMAHSDGYSPVSARLELQAIGPTFGATLELEAGAGLRTNRSGLVVLHSPALSGNDLTVIHSDKSITRRVFPTRIEPHQPATDVSGYRWRGRAADFSLTLLGEVFEMEDQRNWTDASFKTYSRPLADPFPYRIAAGEKIRQCLRLSVEPTADGFAAPPRADTSSLKLRLSGAPFASIFATASNDPDPAPQSAAAFCRQLVELDLQSMNWSAALNRAVAEATVLDVRLVASESEFAAIDLAVAALARVAERGTTIERIGVYDAESHVSTDAAATALRDALAAHQLVTRIAGGSRAHFTELNRFVAELPEFLDEVSFSSTPLFHDQTTAQLVEAVAMQRLSAQQATEIAGPSPVVVGPVTLRPRFNSVATTAPARPTRTDLVEGYGAAFHDAGDPRTQSPELAAWLIASAAAHLVPGVASLAWFESWGARGFMDATGRSHPAHEAFHALTELSAGNGTLLWADSPDGKVWAVGAANAGRANVLAANIDDSARPIRILTSGQEHELHLGPFSWARFETAIIADSTPDARRVRKEQ